MNDPLTVIIGVLKQLGDLPRYEQDPTDLILQESTLAAVWEALKASIRPPVQLEQGPEQLEGAVLYGLKVHSAKDTRDAVSKGARMSGAGGRPLVETRRPDGETVWVLLQPAPEKAPRWDDALNELNAFMRGSR